MIGRGGALLRVCDIYLIVQDVNGEGSVTSRQIGITKRAGELGRLESAVVDFDGFSRAEVSGQDEARCCGVDDREARVGSAGGAVIDDNLRDGASGAELAVPS